MRDRRIYDNRYRTKHPDRVKESKERWRKNNPEKHASHTMAWRQRNPELSKKTYNEWAHRNPEYIAHKTRLRKAMKNLVKSEFYKRSEVYNRDSGICHICGVFIKLDLPPRHPEAFTIDHVIPLSKGGNDILDNVRAAHYSCNSRKGNR